MSDNPSQESSVVVDGRKARDARYERIFQSLPPLDSPEYLRLLKSATPDDLPAPVLARTYRKLHPSPAADATLERLLGHDDRYGYITALHIAARERRSRLDSYTPDDLVCNAVGEIVATLAGPRGELAEGAWAHYLKQCLEDAYRQLVGKRGARVTLRVESQLDDKHGKYDPIETADVASIPWQGCVEPSKLEWLERFVALVIAAIADAEIRAIAFDLFSHEPMQVSSKDPKDPNTLTGRFGVDRFTIYRWQRAAREILRAALERQDECEVDLSCLSRAA